VKPGCIFSSHGKAHLEVLTDEAGCCVFLMLGAPVQYRLLLILRNSYVAVITGKGFQEESNQALTISILNSYEKCNTS
jgi:hypothetical protein